MFKGAGQNVISIAYALSTYLYQNCCYDDLVFISNVLLLVARQIETALEQEAYCKDLREDANKSDAFLESQIQSENFF